MAQINTPTTTNATPPRIANPWELNGVYLASVKKGINEPTTVEIPRITENASATPTESTANPKKTCEMPQPAPHAAAMSTGVIPDLP